VREQNLPHSGLRTIFALLKRISEFPGSTGACSAGIECTNFWLNDDQELSKLLSMQQFPDLLATLKAFAMQNSTASTTALEHLSTLVPQLARGARNLPSAPSCDWQSLWVPTLHVLADIARDGSQKSSAQAFVYLQRLLLERGTELSLPWERLTFPAWNECLEQVLFPLLQQQHQGQILPPDVACARQASAAQLLCRVVLTHLTDWIRLSPDGLPVLFLRLLHVLVSACSSPSAASHARDILEMSLKNLLMVILHDPGFSQLQSPKAGESLIEATWGVISPALPELRREIMCILDPDFEASGPADQGAAA
jgi:hypothetical protein